MPTPASPAKALSNSDIDADLLGTPAAGSAPAGDDVIAEITSSAKLSETPSREGVVQALKPLLPGIAGERSSSPVRISFFFMSAQKQTARQGR